MDIKDMVTFEVNGKKCVALVRKLTERECGRLMGVEDDRIDVIANCGVSRSAQYKMYGNSIVVDVLYHIFRKAFIPSERSVCDGDLFSQGGTISGEFTKENPLRVATLCSGYDSQFMALDRLMRDYPGFAYERVWFAEHDPESNKPDDEQPAVIAHNALYPGVSNLGDMTKIDWQGAKEKYGEIDLLFYSTPCFVAGTLVLTSNGFVKIENVKVGDEIVTHTGNLCRVEKTGKKLSDNIIRVKGMGCDEILCTPNHPFYVREMKRKGHKSIRAWSDPKWKPAGELSKSDYIGFKINDKSELPKWDGTILNYGGHNTVRSNCVNGLLENPDFWYLMGRYVGDGWTRKDDAHKAVVVCCSDRNDESLRRCIENIGIKFCRTQERTTTRYTFSSKELMEFVDRYGHGAEHKRVDFETLSLPSHLLVEFLEGLLDSDGCLAKNNSEYKITTVSRELVYGIQQIVGKLYRIHSRIVKCERPKTCVIEGRTVNQKDTYTIQWHDNRRKQDHAFYANGYVWMPCRGIEKTNNSELVYNLEVEGDHSYTANGVIVHNCQSISQAGLQLGFTEGSGTRSSIIWNVRDALRILQPRFACLENVAAMVSEKFLPMYTLWMETVRGLGYANFSQRLNAKHYGVPQNRDRIFLFSVHEEKNGGTAWYEFPKPIPLARPLKAVLEDSVDPKYYLNPVKVQEFVKKNLVKIREYAEKYGGEIEKLPDELRSWVENYEEKGARGGDKVPVIGAKGVEQCD